MFYGLEESFSITIDVMADVDYKKTDKDWIFFWMICFFTLCPNYRVEYYLKMQERVLKLWTGASVWNIHL